MSALSIRRAHKGDEDLILALLTELAEYEKLFDKFKITKDVIVRDYLCEPPLLNCDLAYESSAPVGLCTWYWTYSSFAARRGIHLEDLFVRPTFRGKRYGKMLLAYLARRAVEGGGGHVEWEVLDWNKPSIDFYERLGATRIQNWFTYRLSDAALEKLAQ